MSITNIFYKLFFFFEPLVVKEIKGPRSRYSAAHDHFSDKQIDPLILTIFLSAIVLLLLAMIIQHHNHMKQIKAQNEEMLKHHKALHKAKKEEEKKP